MARSWFPAIRQSKGGCGENQTYFSHGSRHSRSNRTPSNQGVTLPRGIENLPEREGAA